MSHGSNIPQVPRSKTHQGYFGRMFPNLKPPEFDEEQLKQLALAMYRQKREDSDIPSGYTYFGQFVSHDITFDPTSRLDRINDPEMLNNFRTPRFDLDSIYGRGPEDHPYLYGDVEVEDKDGESLDFTIEPHTSEELLKKAVDEVIKANIVIGINKKAKTIVRKSENLSGGREFWEKYEEGSKIGENISLGNRKWDTMVDFINLGVAREMRVSEEDERNVLIMKREIYKTIAGIDPLTGAKLDKGADARSMILTEADLESINFSVLYEETDMENLPEAKRYILNTQAQKTLDLIARECVYKVCSEFLLHLCLPSDSDDKSLELITPDLSSLKASKALASVAVYLGIKVIEDQERGQDQKSGQTHPIEPRWKEELCEIIIKKIKTFCVNTAKSSMLIGEAKVDSIDANTTKKEPDLPRNIRGKAIIGDPRNDVNVLISQLHLCFLKFHNKIIQELALKQLADEFEGDLFEEAKRIVTWHYQWVVIHDFLKRLVGYDTLHKVLAQGASPKIRSRYLNYGSHTFIPVEFSAAAYRFGHSMVRSEYILNDKLKDKSFPIFLKSTATEGDKKKFEGGLKGGRQLPKEWTIQWDHFLEFDQRGEESTEEEVPVESVNEGDEVRETKRTQYGIQINGNLAPELGAIPIAIGQTISLAEQNLLRGLKLGLPSGQQLARVMGFEPREVSDSDLKSLVNFYKVNRANELIRIYKLEESLDLLNKLNRLNEWLEFVGVDLSDQLAKPVIVEDEENSAAFKDLQKKILDTSEDWDESALLEEIVEVIGSESTESPLREKIRDFLRNMHNISHTETEIASLIDRLSNQNQVIVVHRLIEDLKEKILQIINRIEKKTDQRDGSSDEETMETSLADLEGKSTVINERIEQGAKPDVKVDMSQIKLDLKTIRSLRERLQEMEKGMTGLTITDFLLKKLLEIDPENFNEKKEEIKLTKLDEFILLLNRLINSSVDFNWLNRKMPAWYYILAENTLVRARPNQSNRSSSNAYTDNSEASFIPAFSADRPRSRWLGPVGGTIVAEVLIGILEQDPNSYWSIEPNWTPEKETILPIQHSDEEPFIGNHFELRDIIKYAGMPTNKKEWDHIIPVKSN